MDSLISRQAAIDAQEAYMAYHPLDGYEDELALIDILRNLPSAQPKRKKGEWIEDGYSHYKAVCSECGEPCATYIMGKPRDKFCKWCGADMREDEKDE